jgi:hypothetical protein
MAIGNERSEQNRLNWAQRWTVDVSTSRTSKPIIRSFCPDNFHVGKITWHVNFRRMKFNFVVTLQADATYVQR